MESEPIDRFHPQDQGLIAQRFGNFKQQIPLVRLIFRIGIVTVADFRVVTVRKPQSGQSLPHCSPRRDQQLRFHRLDALRNRRVMGLGKEGLITLQGEMCIRDRSEKWLTA